MKIRVTLLTAGLLLCSVAVLLGQVVFAAPEPVPTAPPASQPTFQISVRKLNLLANDLLTDSVTNKIYATVPSDDSIGGNSITAIDPVAGTTGPRVFVGSDPGKMALSDDRQFIYIILNGAGAVRRFEMASQTAGPQFSVGNATSGTPFFVNDVTVAPGNPHTYAVHRGPGFDGNVAVFDDGVMRTSTVTFSEITSVAFGPTASQLYVYAPFPTPARITRLTVSAAGVVNSGSSQIPTSITTDSVKFVGDRLYTATGKVADPEAGTLVGSFNLGLPGPVPFVVDTANGRAFYVSQAAQTATITIRAFDITTFQSIGSVDVSPVNGVPRSLARWGTNGLAVATAAGEVALIQTDLVSSAEPIPPNPTPSPTATPTPVPTPESFIRKINVLTNDIAYSTHDQKFYATVPSSAGQSGNSIVQINPTTGDVGPSVFVGSEPTVMAISDNGQRLHFGFEGETSIGSFDVNSQLAGPKFVLFHSPPAGGRIATDIAVAPGSSDSIAVSSGQVAIFDSGVRRPNSIGSTLATMEYGDSASRLYTSQDGGLRVLQADPSGLTQLKNFPNLISSSMMSYSGGRLFIGSTGSFARVFDPEAGALVGSVRVGNNQLPSGERCDRNVVLSETSNNRLYMLCSEVNPPNGFVKIKVFDSQTYLLKGEIGITGTLGDLGRLVRWGTNGLAFRTSSGQLWLIESNLVSTALPIPAATPTPSPTPTVTPTPFPSPANVRELALVTRDMVIDPNTQTIFASIPTSAGSGADSLTPIDPAAGTVGSPIPIGSNPNRMALSGNNQFIYVGLDGARAIRRFDVATRTPGLQFDVGIDPQFGPMVAQDMSVSPGQPGTIAVARARVGVSPEHGGVAIYDDGVQRPVTTPSQIGSNAIGYSGSPSVLYGNDTSSNTGFKKMGVASCGVSTASLIPESIADRFKVANGLIYTRTSKVINPEDFSLLGIFRASGNFNAGIVLPDLAAGKVYFVVDAVSGYAVRVFDARTFLLIREMRISTSFDPPDPVTMVRWGANGIAFSTGTKVFLIEDPIIGGSAPPPPVTPLPAAPTFTVSGQINVASQADDVRIDITGAITASTVLSSSSPNFSFGGIPACGSVTITPSKPDYIFSPASYTFNNPSEFQSANFSVTPVGIRLSASAVTISETLNFTTFTVLRAGDTSQAATVDYETVPGTASDRSDYTAVSGTLTFAPGVTSRSIQIPLANDFLVEGPEFFNVRIKNAVGMQLREPNQLTITITDNDFSPPTTNPLDGAAFFVRRHYHDFLNREPDTAGLNFWTNEIQSCGTDTACLEVKRINVSAAFFLSIEFQETGYLVYRVYKSGFGNIPGAPVPIRLNDFLRDTQQIGRGVQVGVGDWQTALEANKQAFALAFVQRSDFLTAFPNSMTAAEFVTKLDVNAGGVLSTSEQNDLIVVLGSTPADIAKRTAVLRAVSEDETLRNAEFNRAFVLMQYFGYMRRSPDETPNSDFSGYNFWLGKLDSFGGNFVNAEMVKAFIVSSEYRQRFGP